MQRYNISSILESCRAVFAAAPLEQQQGHIAVFPIIGVEQRELLRAICVGIRVIGINMESIGL